MPARGERFQVSILADDDDALYIRTQLLNLEIMLGNFAIHGFDLSGNSTAFDLAAHAHQYDHASKGMRHYLEHRDGDHYFGFGEQNGTLDKVGKRMRMLNLDSLRYGRQRVVTRSAYPMEEADAV